MDMKERTEKRTQETDPKMAAEIGPKNDLKNGVKRMLLKWTHKMNRKKDPKCLKIWT